MEWTKLDHHLADKLSGILTPEAIKTFIENPNSTAYERSEFLLYLERVME